MIAQYPLKVMIIFLRKLNLDLKTENPLVTLTFKILQPLKKKVDRLRRGPREF